MKVVILQVMFLTIAAVLYSAENKYIDFGHSSQEEEATNNLQNICSVKKVPMIYCLCDSIEPAKASRARCWIVGPIQKNNTIWNDFQTQPNLENVLLTAALNWPGLTYLPTDIIRDAKKLKNFEINFANVSRIHPLSFQSSESLQQISLASNRISTLDHHAFTNLVSLKNLSLDNNELTEIQSSAFFALPKLKRLNVENNKITTLHNGTFKHLATLTELNMNRNSLSTLTRGSFEGLSSILRLEIKRNKLTNIADYTFIELMSLEELFLDENQIKHVSEHALLGLKSLKKLSFAGNDLSNLADTVFYDVTNINYLDLSNNELTELGEDLFRPMFKNMRRSDFALKLDDNTLACDCSLSWLESIRNDTKSHALQLSLDALLCSSEYRLPYLLPTHSKEEEEQTTKRAQLIYGFEEPAPYQPTPEKARNTKMYFQKNLFKILLVPQRYLPCKKTSKSSMKQSSVHIEGHMYAQSPVLPFTLLSLAN